MSKYKLAIVMRADLGMGKGKLCVQAGHASTIVARKALFEKTDDIIRENPSRKLWYIWHEWFDEGQFKICLKVKNSIELLEIERMAKLASLPVSEVRDFGITQVPSNSLTCIAIGPALSEEVDKITHALALL